ncbi:hypothetical protein L6164_017400 [Bauhinia variegata]|uniref:Uncharacterized protein n=1 Tax=Bauhinia variegata TaxID=167791 RepID=A0ACB9N8D9_BAUVA|nr:hypothetical protein L6164_017400 [Bauhinia variegata]
MSSDELVKVIACFIVELFFKYYYNEWTSNDYKMLHPVGSIDIDLLLLENQVPFFILEKLYNLVLASQDRKRPHFLSSQLITLANTTDRIWSPLLPYATSLICFEPFICNN